MKLSIALFCFLLTFSLQAQNTNPEPNSNSALKEPGNVKLDLQQRLERVQAKTSLEDKDHEFLALYAAYPHQFYGGLPYQLAQEYAIRADIDRMLQYRDIFLTQVAQFPDDHPGIDAQEVSRGLLNLVGMQNPVKALPYLRKEMEARCQDVDALYAAQDVSLNKLQVAKEQYFDSQVRYFTALSKTEANEEGFQRSKLFFENVLKEKEEMDRRVKLAENVFLKSAINNGNYKTAFPMLDLAAREYRTSDFTESQLLKAYHETYGDTVGFTLYRQEVKDAALSHIRAEIRSLMVSRPAFDFQLYDVDGRLVKLSDFRGKTVVLDFWATWCGPCKASFPGMQKVVHSYKDDPDVKFLFIHTLDKSNEPALEAKKYIYDNKYSFHVLMDLRNPQTKESAVAKAYQVEGIPTKVIIDPKGRIRFQTSGFIRDIDKAVQELSIMIEISRRG